MGTSQSSSLGSMLAAARVLGHDSLRRVTATFEDIVALHSTCRLLELGPGIPTRLRQLEQFAITAVGMRVGGEEYGGLLAPDQYGPGPIPEQE